MGRIGSVIAAILVGIVSRLQPSFGLDSSRVGNNTGCVNTTVMSERGSWNDGKRLVSLSLSPFLFLSLSISFRIRTGKPVERRTDLLHLCGNAGDSPVDLPAGPETRAPFPFTFDILIFLFLTCVTGLERGKAKTDSQYSVVPGCNIQYEKGTKTELRIGPLHVRLG